MKFEPERLDIVIRKLGKGQQKLFAKLLNVTPSAISRWKAEKEIPEKYCSVLELLGVNINWLETGDGEPFFEPSNVKPIDIDIESVIKKATRLVGIKRVLVPANAGRGYNFDTIEEEVVMYDPFDWLLNSKEWLMFTISGDSMIPMICPDATVYVQTTLKPTNGKIIVCTLNGILYCKVYNESNGKVFLTSCNPQYNDKIEVSEYDDFRIIGVVRKMEKPIF